jgi:hypothetical protein
VTPTPVWCVSLFTQRLQPPKLLRRGFRHSAHAEYVGPNPTQILRAFKIDESTKVQMGQFESLDYDVNENKLFEQQENEKTPAVRSRDLCFESYV